MRAAVVSQRRWGHGLHAGSEWVVGVVPLIAGVAGGGDQLCAFDAPPGAQEECLFQPGNGDVADGEQVHVVAFEAAVMRFWP